MLVLSTSPVSSYSSLTRQDWAQPSQSDSHSARLIWTSVLVRQKGTSPAPSAGDASESLLKVFEDVIGRNIRRVVSQIASIRPHDIDDRRVVHRIVRALADLLVVDTIDLGGTGDFLRRAGKRDKPRGKIRRIGLQHPGRVAVRIDSDE